MSAARSYQWRPSGWAMRKETHDLPLYCEMIVKTRAQRVGSAQDVGPTFFFTLPR